MINQQSLRRLYSVSYTHLLDNIKELLERLGNPQDQLKVVHIAGTNGKGSTLASVSYTHLDVYKRQINDNGFIRSCTARYQSKRATEDSELILTVDYSAVSFFCLVTGLVYHFLYHFL